MKRSAARLSRSVQNADEIDEILETQTRILQAVNDTLRSHNNVIESLKERVARSEERR